MPRSIALLFLIASIVSVSAGADLPNDEISTEVLDYPGDNWVWVLDGVGELSTSRVFDTTTGEMKGMLSLGYWSSGIALPSHHREIYAIQTHYARSTRGPRTDVIAVHSAETLQFLEEIEIPPRRMTALTSNAIFDLTPDDRFLLVQNFTPAQTVTLVDVESRTFVQELETPGCVGVFALADRLISTVCGDGSLLWFSLRDDGSVKERGALPPFFSPADDPVQTDAVQLGNLRLFASNQGYVYPIDASSGKPEALERWSFLTDEERSNGWRYGGFHRLAVHAPSRTLYILVQQGGAESYEFPANEVWVFDVDTKERVARHELANPSFGIAISASEQPQFFASSVYVPLPDWATFLLYVFGYEATLEEFARFGLDVYDAADGSLIRSIENTTTVPTHIQRW